MPNEGFVVFSVAEVIAVLFKRDFKSLALRPITFGSHDDLRHLFPVVCRTLLRCGVLNAIDQHNAGFLLVSRQTDYMTASAPSDLSRLVATKRPASSGEGADFQQIAYLD